jgi:two-component system CheB/CheR fusion protein
VVGVGASAGGLEAFTSLLEHLPPDTGMAFVLVQHLAPAKDSILAELLARTTAMPVREARDGVRVEPNHVYVIPPNTLMTVFHGRLRLQPRPETHAPNLPIDFFLRSLAEDQGENAIGVILSGTGSDGSVGIRAIKAEGGIVLAQDGQSARYDGMPRSAAATGAADYVLPPDKMAVELRRIARHPAMKPRPGAVGGPELAAREDDLNRIFMLVRAATGVDFTYYKHSTILRRINRRMLLHKLDALGDYVRFLQQTPAEVGVLYQDFLINVTAFFREPEAFTVLKNVVFPRLLLDRSSDMPLRVWVPGCATGEEAYSLAMCFSEFCEERGVFPPIQFFASDIDEAAIESARHGVYADTIAQDVSPERLRRFFARTERGYQISKAIREQCVFARQNLVKDPPFSRMDLISCRNVLIYFGPVLQKRVLPIFHYALNPAGFLMLGRSESVGGFSSLFSLVDKGSRIFSRKAVATQPHPGRQDGAAAAFPAAKGATAERAGGAPDLAAEADGIILSRYSPAGLVINESLDILQFRGNVSPYLKPQPGKASLNLMKMAGESFALELRLLVRQAAGKDVPVRKAGLRVRNDDVVSTVDVEVVALKPGGAPERHFLVVFTEAVPPRPPGAAPPDGAAAKPGRRPQKADEAEALARELAETRRHLQSVVAEHEASTEELKALNEEVQSSNEELQSINEELETSKEELQSTNEELSTVNDELRSRNEEIAQSNNDLLNVLSGVDIPILLVGSKLQIRRFNSAAAKALNLIPGDVGRPISDIRPNVVVADLDRMILEVVDSLAVRTLEIQDRDGRWYAMAIRPYKTADNRIDGALVSFEDINDLKLGMLRLGEARDYAEAIVETVREALVVLRDDLRVVTANQAYYRAFAAAPDALENRGFFEVQDGLWNVPGLRAQLERAVRDDVSLNDFEVDFGAAGAARRVLLLSARRIAREGSALVLLAIEDVTERRLAEERVGQLNADLQANLGELAAANAGLEAFTHSVSHELHAPLRTMTQTAGLLAGACADHLDERCRGHLAAILDGAGKMNLIIDDLLRLSQVSRQPLLRTDVDVSKVAAGVAAALAAAHPEPPVVFVAAPGLRARADASLVEVVLGNLLGNAWKFAAKAAGSRVEFGGFAQEGRTVFFVRDNGAGFDQAHSARMFRPFQRLHPEQDYPGTGIGLAIVEQVIQRHGGRIWAEGKPGEGATFFFTLG